MMRGPERSHHGCAPFPTGKTTSKGVFPRTTTWLRSLTRMGKIRQSEISPNGGRMQVYFGGWNVGRGLMNSRAKAARILGVAVFVVGSILPGRAQVSEDPAASLSQIEGELKQHPNSPKLYVALGLAYWDRNDYPHALEAFQRAVKLGPASAEAHNWLGVATLEKGDFPGAAAEFRKAIPLDPKYARAYANLGSALAKNGELAEAVEVFRKALVLEPKNAAARVNLAVALREKGDAKGALVHLRLVAEREPNNVNVEYLLGQALQQSGDLR